MHSTKIQPLPHSFIFYVTFCFQAEWPERYAVAAATVKSLQQRMEESKRSGKEKDASAARLKSHVRQLEEKLLKTCREAEEREARRERESNMLQDVSLSWEKETHIIDILLFANIWSSSFHWNLATICNDLFVI